MVTTSTPNAPDAAARSGRSGFGTPLLGRADPPESQWAGRWINEEDVALSSGDDRDWFTLEQRMATFHEGVQRYQTARRRRRKLSSGFNFAQVMFVGDMGAKKSVAMGHEAYKWFQRGHPFFHNGGYNFGRLVEGAEIYELVDRVPRNAVIAIDEAHTGLESGMAMATGVRAFAILGAGVRKKNCKLLMASAMAKMVVRTVREMTSEVRRPLQVGISVQDHGYSLDYPEHSNPLNFVLVWQVWLDFPFRGVDLTEGKRRGRNNGLGPADDTRMAQGEGVRNSFLLTDSFRPVDTAHAQRYAGKAAMDEARSAQTGFTDDHRHVVTYLWERATSGECPAFIKPEMMGMALGMKPSAVGRLMNGIFGDVAGVRKKDGYDMAIVGNKIAERFNVE